MSDYEDNSDLNDAFLEEGDPQGRGRGDSLRLKVPVWNGSSRGANFTLWELRLRSVMMEHGCWDAARPVGREETMPQVSDRRTNKARALLLTSIGDRQLGVCTANGEMDPRNILDRLREINSGITVDTAPVLMSKVLGARIGRGESAEDFYARLQQMESELATIGRSIDEDLMTATFRRGLMKDRRYDNVRDVTDHSKNAIEILLAIKQYSILMGDDRHDSSQSRSRLNYASGSTSRRDPPTGGDDPYQPRERKKGKCHNCGKEGHYIKECRSKGQPEDQRGNKGPRNGPGPGPGDKKGKAAIFTLKMTSSKVMEVITPASRDHQYGMPVFIDSGANVHACGNRAIYTEYEKFDSPVSIDLATSDAAATCIGQGTLEVETTSGDVMVLKEVRHVVGMDHLLVSVAKFERATGGAVIFAKGKVTMQLPSGENAFEGELQPGVDQPIYEVTNIVRFLETDSHMGDLASTTGHSVVMNITSKVTPPESTTIGGLKENQALIYHWRLGHASVSTMKKMIASGLLPKTLQLDDLPALCGGCEMGKAHRAPFEEGRTRAKEVNELIHADVQGPFARSIGGFKYAAMYTDDATGYTTCYTVKTKEEVQKCTEEYILMAEKRHGHPVKFFRCDGGGEYVNGTTKAFFKSKGIIIQTSAPHTPQHNGVAERAGRTIGEIAEAIRYEAGLSKGFWAHAYLAASSIKNARASQAVGGETPYKLWNGVNKNYEEMRVFGSKGWCFIPKATRRKLQPKSRQGIYLHTEEDSKTYQMWDPEKHTTFAVRINEVKFDEGVLPAKKENTKLGATATNNIERVGPMVDAILPASVGAQEEECSAGNVGVNPTSILPMEDHHQAGSTRGGTQFRRARPRTMTTVVTESTESAIPAATYVVPKSYQQAMAAADSDKWRAAMESEYNSLLDNNTWELVDRPSGVNVIGCMWVNAIKVDQAGNISRRKSRLVALGNQQVQGHDFMIATVSSPVIDITCFRLLLCLEAQHGWWALQVDIVTAYLNSSIEEDIYMCQPKGYIKQGEENKVCKLRKALYGLRQAGERWYQELSSTLANLGLNSSEHEPCLFISSDKDILMGVYVDDFRIVAKDEKKGLELVESLKKKYQVKELGKATQLVGISINYPISGGIQLHQKSYINETLLQFGLQDAKVKKMPLPLSVLEDAKGWAELPEVSKEDKLLFQSMLGSLLWIARCTRPDIAFAVGFLGRHTARPTTRAIESAKHVLRYLKGSMEKVLFYQQGQHENLNNKDELLCYSDSDFAGDTTTRKSTGGHVVLLNGGPILWVSRQQKVVAASTMEAEYFAAYEASRDVVWLRRIMDAMGLETITQKPTPMLIDNQSVIAVIKHGAGNARRVKHLDVKVHLVKELHVGKVIEAKYVETEVNASDLMTKPLSGVRTVELSKMVSLIDKMVEG